MVGVVAGGAGAYGGRGVKVVGGEVGVKGGVVRVWGCAHHVNPCITGVGWAPILPDAVR
jgi:hypothetical protein